VVDVDRLIATVMLLKISPAIALDARQIDLLLVGFISFINANNPGKKIVLV